MAGYHRRRRRLRADQAPRAESGERTATPAADDSTAGGRVSAATRSVHDPEPPPESTPIPRPAPPSRPAVDDVDDRGLRGLVGSGSTQVGVSAASRARDAARPTEADMAAAEADVVIVRRNWVPRAEPR